MKYLCEDCKDSNIFYVFNTSLKKIKKKDNIPSQNKNLFTYANKDDNDENNKSGNEYLQKKRNSDE